MSKLANANNSFGFDLFSQLETEQNIVISPSSIALALAMIRNGTGEETLAEVTTVLNLERFEPQIVDASYARFIEILESTDVDVELAIAKFWVNQNIALKARFVNLSLHLPVTSFVSFNERTHLRSSDRRYAIEIVL